MAGRCAAGLVGTAGAPVQHAVGQWAAAWVKNRMGRLMRSKGMEGSGGVCLEFHLRYSS